jgi:hypothetical protein
VEISRVAYRSTTNRIERLGFGRSCKMAAEVPLKAFAVLAVVCLTALLCEAQSSNSKHKISIAFDYDFSKTPVCPAKTAQSCVTQFNLYDISAGIQRRTKLMSFPPPAGATGVVKGIAATTPSLPFESGRHLLAVTAQMSKGDESDPNKCTIWVEVP